MVDVEARVVHRHTEPSGARPGRFHRVEVLGPGQVIAPVGLPPHFERMWAENGALYPRGVDLVLAAGGQILCLPRTTRLARKES